MRQEPTGPGRPDPALVLSPMGWCWQVQITSISRSDGEKPLPVLRDAIVGSIENRIVKGISEPSYSSNETLEERS
jgi:hypothetical protein